MLCVLVCVMLVLSLTACDDDTPKRRDDDNDRKPTPTREVTPGEPTPTAEATPTGTTDPTPTAEATPTGTPIDTPTAVPTATPTGAAEPTPTSVDTPTPTPTTAPTATPTGAATPTPTKAPTATPTPTKAPTATPTPIPLPSQLASIKEYKSDRPNKALLAYAKYLDEKCRIGDGTKVRYGLFFLNSDETPELWWGEGGSHVDTVNICMFDGTDVKELGSVGEFGSFTYIPKRNTIVNSYAAMGHSWVSMTVLDGTKLVKADEFHIAEYDTPSGTEVHYYVNDQECTKKEYESRYKTWQFAKATTAEYGDGISVFNSEDGKSIWYTQYIALFNKYVSLYPSYPFKYGIPEDMYEMLMGRWNKDSHDDPGNPVYYWEFPKIGEQKIVYGTTGNTKTIVLKNQKLVPGRYEEPDYALSLWRLRFEDPSRPGYYYELYMHADGRLFEDIYDGQGNHVGGHTLWKQ